MSGDETTAILLTVPMVGTYDLTDDELIAKAAAVIDSQVWGPVVRVDRPDDGFDSVTFGRKDL